MTNNNTNPSNPREDELNYKNWLPCPFCGAGRSMLYKINGKDALGFTRPEMFCDACKATVYFEDSTSTGVDVGQDFAVLETALIKGWNSRKSVSNQAELAAQTNGEGDE